MCKITARRHKCGHLLRREYRCCEFFKTDNNYWSCKKSYETTEYFSDCAMCVESKEKKKREEEERRKEGEEKREEERERLWY